MRRASAVLKPLGTWLVRQLVRAVVVLWLVVTAIFIGVRAIPGDPAEAIMGGPGSQASAEALDMARAEYGLDRPLVEQYLIFLGNLLRGDLGVSYSYQDPVTEIIGDVFPQTLLLAVVSLLTAWLLALVLSLISVGRGRASRWMTSLLEIIAAAVPHFWLGAVLITVFSTNLGLLPSIDNGRASGLILPALTLAIPMSGFMAQLMRDSLTQAMSSPFVLAARARGASTVQVFFAHGLRHSILPVLNMSGWSFSSLLSGAVVVEEVFARPGIGRALLQGVLSRDIPLVTGIAVLCAVCYIVVMALAEATEQLINPAGADQHPDQDSPDGPLSATVAEETIAPSVVPEPGVRRS
ncbi:ABC transporter permease [Auritidibacter sp. NML100628]|nr:ABC transporter permease [Auritidibacter sp. NML100628]